MSNTGEVVSVQSSLVSLDDLSDEIVTNINLSRELVNTFNTQLATSIENLNDLVGEFDPKIKDISTLLPAISGPGFPARPSFGALGLDNSWPDSTISNPVLRDFGVLDFNLTVPTPPAEVDESFTWTERNYSSDMWQALFTTVNTAILSGSYGLSDAVHSAIVEREKESRRRSQDKEYRTGLAMVGASGFNFHGGRVAAFLSEFQAEILQRDQDALNNLTDKDFLIANEREKMFLATGTDLERLLRETFSNAENRSLDAAKAAKEYIARFLSENIRLFLGKYEGERIRLEALKSKIDAIASANKSEVDVFLGRAQVLTSRYQAISEKNRSLVDARRGEIEIYSAEVNAVAAEYNALVEEVKVNQLATRSKIELEMKKEEIRLAAYSEKAKLGQVVGLGVTQVLAQGMASALGTINTSLSNSYSGSENKAVSWSAQLSESGSVSEQTVESTSTSTNHNYNYDES